jgi:hypothetical protein
MIGLLLCAVSWAQPHNALFVGNSYTAFHAPDNLSGAYQKLLEEGKPGWTPLDVRFHAPGGVSFEGHLQAAQDTGPLHDLLTGAAGVSEWNVVVFQDQSQVPSFPQDGTYYTASRDAVVVLAQMATALGATPHLLQTWGRRDGDEQNTWRNADFSTMNQHLADGYDGYAEAIRAAGMEAEIIQAGEGWRIIHDDLVAAGVTPTEGDTLFTRLYVQDGSHPSPHGTYLAACIAYATVTGQSPVGLSWAHTGISAEDKARLQAVAAEVAVGLGDTPDDSDDDTDPGDSPTPESNDTQSDRNENAPAPGGLCGCASHSRPPATLVWGFLAVILAGQRRRPSRTRRAADSRWYSPGK